MHKYYYAFLSDECMIFYKYNNSYLHGTWFLDGGTSRLAQVNNAD